MKTLILPVKLFLMSAAAVSLAMGIKLSVPVVVSEVPVLWSMVQPWTKPPWLYIIVNGIIITIAASSRFQKVPTEQQQTVRVSERTHLITVRAQQQQSDSSAKSLGTKAVESRTGVVYESDEEEEDRVVELKPVVLVNGSILDDDDDDAEIKDEEEEMMADDEDDELYEDVYVDTVVTHSTAATEKVVFPDVRPEYLSPVMVKPPVASTIGRRKPTRTSTPEGGRRPPRVERQQKHETLESIWNRITEGRHGPLAMHVKNSDTTEQLGDDYGSPPSYGIQKEVSPGQEELNRRAEEFIKKFNEDMRLQRQESLEKHLEMVNRGV